MAPREYNKAERRDCTHLFYAQVKHDTPQLLKQRFCAH